MTDSQLTHTVDGTAVLLTLGTLMDILPKATAVLTFLWVLIRLYETKTVQNALKRVRKWRSR